MTTDDLIESLKVHQFQPGDRVVLRVRGRLEEDTARRLKEAWDQWAPGVPCIVMEENVALEVIRGIEIPPLSDERIQELRKAWELAYVGLKSAVET